MVVGDEMNGSCDLGMFHREQGFPEVAVRKMTEGQYILTQSRSLIDKNTSKSYKPSEYSCITYITDLSNVPVRKWFHTCHEEIGIRVDEEIKWIKFNSEHIAFYRVNYEPTIWLNLKQYIQDMPTTDRISIIVDAFSLSSEGRIGYDILLSLSENFKHEKEFIPWFVAAKKFLELKKVMENTRVFQNLRKYITELVENRYKELTWEVSQSNTDIGKMRVIILELACSFGHAECLKEAAQRFKTWLEKPEQKPHTDVRALIYIYGMATEGTPDLWFKMWEIYKIEKDHTEKLRLLNGLAAIREPWLLSRFIDFAWDEKNVKKQDYITCLQYIAGNPIGMPLVWDYMRENWDKLVKRNDRNLAQLIPHVTARFTTAIKLKEMKDFFSENPVTGACETARQQASENIENILKWQTNYLVDVENWLARYYNE